jgi:FecR protein
MTPAPQHSYRLRFSGFLLLLLLSLPVPTAWAQSDACTLVPDPHSPGDKILRCGASLTITPAAGTVYHIVGAGSRPPTRVELDSGALLIQFDAGRRLRDFQILTPLAIAAVRGTKWAMDVGPERSSALVLAGRVKVARRDGADAVTLGPGEGVDVTAAPGPLVVKRWPPERVHALLQRLGQ